MKLSFNKDIKLIDYNDLSQSVLIKAIGEFYNFPNHFHDFKIKNDTEHYIEIEFYNYQKTHCSVLYQKTFNDIRLNKGIGGVNFDYLKLINNLIELGVFVFIED